MSDELILLMILIIFFIPFLFSKLRQSTPSTSDLDESIYKKCLNCNTENLGKASFCKECGKKLKEINTSANSIEWHWLTIVSFSLFLFEPFVLISMNIMQLSNDILLSIFFLIQLSLALTFFAFPQRGVLLVFLGLLVIKLILYVSVDEEAGVYLVISNWLIFSFLGISLGIKVNGSSTFKKLSMLKGD